MKEFKSENYNFLFNDKTGFFIRWGKNINDNPLYSSYGNEILDIEITDICKGPGNVPCPFCYKSNKPTNKSNMSFSDFKIILDKMPKTLTQIAIGADAQATSNTDLWKMMEYSRNKGIIPNITVADISLETAKNIKKYCGAVAVSRYENKNYCYNSINLLSTVKMKQINMHIMICNETYDQVLETFNDVINKESRLKNLNAIVLLSLKQKGRGENFTPLSDKKFKYLLDFSLKHKIPIGFDSCSCNKVLKALKNHKNFKKFQILSEPCESSCFSAYINSKGYYFPCSFSEGNDNWKTGLNVIKCNNFVNDIWNSNKNKIFRKKLLKNNRNCPIYKI